MNTDLTDKAGTKTPVEVTAEPGSKVELFDKDGNKIGEATADNNGKATITPTVDIPAGNVTAKATDAAGNTSDASDPMVATNPRTDADKNTPSTTIPAPKAAPAPMMHKQTPASSAAPANPKMSSVSTATKKQALPETGDDASMAAMALGGILAAAGLGLAGKRKKED